MNFYVGVVLYNKDIRESLTCKQLLGIRQHNTKIYILDNSTIQNSNELYALKYQWIYINMGGNAGLSKAYNCFLEQLPVEDGVVIFLDDDTAIIQEYFDELEMAVSMYKDCDIFTPIIIGNDKKIWSPNRAGFLKNSFITDVKEKISDTEYNAINSGTAVRKSVLNNYRYDERLFLDQVDHKFYYDQRKAQRRFYKMQTVILQNFSQRNSDFDAESIWVRLQVRLKDIMEYGRILGGKYKLLAFCKNCGISIQLAMRVKSVALLRKTIILSVRLFFS